MLFWIDELKELADERRAEADDETPDDETLTSNKKIRRGQGRRDLSDVENSVSGTALAVGMSWFQADGRLTISVESAQNINRLVEIARAQFVSFYPDQDRGSHRGKIRLFCSPIWFRSTLLVSFMTFATVSPKIALGEFVDVDLRGYVTTTRVPFISIGDELSWQFTYEVNSLGEGDNVNFSSDIIYRCLNIVTEASASIGNEEFGAFPASNPFSRRESLLQVENTDSYDQFQGRMSFEDSTNMTDPIIAFYLLDPSGGAFDPFPRFPATWNESSLSQFRDSTFILFDYSSGSPRQVASGIIGSDVPEPSSALWGQIVLGGLIAQRRRANQSGRG